MAYEKVKRNRYYDPPSEYPHSSRNHAEDMQEYHMPMERMQNANLYNWGIARGLEVSGTIGGTKVVIQPGVAIDGNGQLISLSSAGHGDIGANPPGGQHNEVTVPVDLGIGGHAGQTVYVTIQFSEILRPAEGSGGRMEQVPWLRLQTTGAYVDDGTSIILAIAEINAAGNLASLKAADGAITHGRRVIGQSIEELHIQRSTKVGDDVKEVASGKIEPGTGGGLQITVPHTGDGVSFAKEGGGNFANLEVRANTVVVKDSAGREALKFDANDAKLTVGTNGNEGDIIVRDGAGREVMNFDGASAWLEIGASGNEGDIAVVDGEGRRVMHFNSENAALYIGAEENEGDLRIRNNSGDETIKLDGNTGHLISNDRIIAGNPARYVTYRWLHADNGTATQEVNLRSRRKFTAFVSIIGMDPRHDFDRGDAFAVDVFTVDGNRTFAWAYGGDHFGPSGSPTNIHAPTFTGEGQRIVFRARSFQDASVFAIGVVFYE